MEIYPTEILLNEFSKSQQENTLHFIYPIDIINIYAKKTNFQHTFFCTCICIFILYLKKGVF